jgi:hypothetical protein
MKYIESALILLDKMDKMDNFGVCVCLFLCVRLQFVFSFFPFIQMYRGKAI